MLLACWLAPGAARADDQPNTVSHSYSPYEQASIDEAAAQLETKPDPAPEGKIVEGIDVVTLDVIERRDPAPAALNWLHATSRHYVIEREVLLSVGEKYQRGLCDETARNLRGLPQLSLVICAATQGSSPDRVRVLVITKDIWSLRMGWDVSFIGGGIESLQLVPTEANLAGSHQIVLGTFVYQPESLTAGVGYRIPRLDGRRLGLSADLSLTWNRNGELEGSGGSLGVGKSLYTARTEWAWSIGTSWSDGIARLYRNGKVAVDPNGVLWAYRSRRVAEGAQHHPIVRLGDQERLYRRRGDEPSPVQPAGAARSRPARDRRVYRAEPTERRNPRRAVPSVPRLHVELLARARLRDARLARRLSPRPRHLVAGLSGHRGARLVAHVSRNLRRVSVHRADGRRSGADLGGLDHGRRSLDLLRCRGRGRLAPGNPAAWIRPHRVRRRSAQPVSQLLEPAVVPRWRRATARLSELRFERGKDLLVYNLEFRSRPVEIFACQLGGAAFFDVGDAANGFDKLHMRQSAGFGFRILFPQLDRIVFRGDIGFPLGDRSETDPTQPKLAPYTIAIAFEQAFSMPGVGGRVGSSTGSGYLGQ